MKNIILKLTLFGLLLTTAQTKSSSFTEKIVPALQGYAKSLRNFAWNHKKKLTIAFAIAPIIIGGVLAATPKATPIESEHYKYDTVCPYFHYKTEHKDDTNVFD